MLNIDALKNRKELRSFLGLVNYYRNMWIRQSDVLVPLTKLTSKDVKWQWTEVETKAFSDIKRILADKVLLLHPDCTIAFEIHTDASNYQLSAVISQENKPIAFDSRKLKEFKNILMGHRKVVHTDHKNLTYKVFNTDRVMRWRLICEQFGAKLRYINGAHNIVADALSRLHLQPSLKSKPNHAVLKEPEYRMLHKAFPFDKLPADAFPLCLNANWIGAKSQHNSVTFLKKGAKTGCSKVSPFS